MSYYRELANGRAFYCSRCGRRKHVKYVPSSTLCRDCAAIIAGEKRSSTNTLVQVSDSAAITSQVHRKLMKEANHTPLSPEIKKWNAIEGAMLALCIPASIVLFFYYIITLAELKGGEWLIIVAPFMCAAVAMQVIERLRRWADGKRGELIKTRFQELVDERYARLEEQRIFYSSPEWKRIREIVIDEEGNTCSECGRLISKKEDITVDHKQPRSKYPKLALNRSNLRVVCRQCNSMKGDSDWEGA